MFWGIASSIALTKMIIYLKKRNYVHTNKVDVVLLAIAFSLSNLLFCLTAFFSLIESKQEQSFFHALSILDALDVLLYLVNGITGGVLAAWVVFSSAWKFKVSD